MKPEATMEQEHEAEAVLSVSCCVDCPNCNDTFDLFDMTSLTDDGYLYKELLEQDDGFGRVNWGEIVQCPTCKATIIIKDVIW